MRRIRILLFAGLILLPVAAWAQESAFPSYTLDGQLRHRYEWSDRDFDADRDAVAFNLLRTRLGARFLPAAHTEVRLQFQDARTFGEETNTLTDGAADHLDLHQGYLRLTDLFGAPVDLQLGRFEVIYGGERLLGAVGWHNIGRSFDGVRVRLHPARVTLDVFNLKEVEALEPGGRGDRNVFGVYGDAALLEGYTTQGYVIWQRGNPSATLNRYTVGGYLKGRTGNVRAEAEAAFQGGTLDDRDVSAFLAALQLGYAFPDVAGAPVLSAGIDYLSGDDDPDDGTVKVFDTLYATNHKFYGFMDFFLNLPVNTLGLGLRDVHAGVAVAPEKGLNLRLTYHNFAANENFAPAAGATRFGDEVDLTAVYRYNPKVAFTGGASLFVPGPIFDRTRGKDTAAWLYLMTTVNL